MQAMGKLRLSLVLLAAACGSDKNNPVDAHIVVPDTKVFEDAPPKVFMDAPPPTYDFTCFGKTAPTTALDPITVGGVTETFGTSGLTPLGGFTVETFATGGTTPLDTQTSAMTTGTFTTGNIVTHARASLATYRTSYVYPPNPIVKNLTNTPVPVISDAAFAQINQVLTQTDATNGLLLVTIADCALTPIAGGTLTAKQNNQSVGTILDLGSFAAQLAGLYFVANVPDGDVTIGASYQTMTFPSHVVHAYKKPDGNNTEGTVTVSAVVPGPF